jgi:hypothetical protein
MQTIALSEAALALFRLHFERHGDVAVDDTTRPIYRELARLGLMRPVSTYAGGPESAYRTTKEGFGRRAEILARARESA